MLRVTFHIQNEARQWDNKQFLCQQVEFENDGTVTLLFSDGSTTIKAGAYKEMTVYYSVFEEASMPVLYNGIEPVVVNELYEDPKILEELIAELEAGD